MIAWWHELTPVAESLRFDSTTAFTVLGRRHESSENGTTPDNSLLTAEAVTALADILYSVLHCREPAEPSSLDGYSDWSGARDFAQALSHANHGRGSWESGWVIRGEGAGRIIGERNGLRFWVPPEDVRTSHPLTDGAGAAVKVPKEFRQLLPGFYLALGDAEHDGNLPDVVRVYWHIRPAGAAALTALITERLNRAGVPFRLKLVSDPLNYRRSDAAVLYLPRPSWPHAAPLLAELSRDIRPHLRLAVSAYVKRLTHGVGVAEDPDDGSSFGQHRSRLLATALASPPVVEATSVSARLDLMEASLHDAGFHPSRFHLNPGSSDEYEPFDGGA